MDKMPPVNKYQKPNTECFKDCRQKKKLNDGSFMEKERKRVNVYRAKKKQNQPETKNYSAENRNTNFKIAKTNVK